MVYLHSLPAGETRERVACKLTLDHFKDKLFNKTLRSGLHEYALYRLSPLHKIKGNLTLADSRTTRQENADSIHVHK